jgi:hypothetical protein
MKKDNLYKVVGSFPEKNAVDGKCKFTLTDYAFSEEHFRQYLAISYPALEIESIKLIKT